MKAHKCIIPIEDTPLIVCFGNASAVPESETCEALKDMSKNIEAFKQQIEAIEITPIIQGQLNKIAGSNMIEDPLDKLMLAFSTTFSVNDQLETPIEGHPGSHILVNFLARKACGDAVTAHSLQMELFENKVETNEDICNMADILADYYIKTAVTFKTAPKSYPLVQPT